MGTEILDVSDHFLGAVANGIYQGILITVLVALSFRVFSRINAATRHAIWLCTLVLLVLLVVAHCFFLSSPPALQPGNIARTTATPEQEIGTLNIAAVMATANSPLKKPPGEGTGPTRHGDFRGNLVGRLPSRGEQDVFEQAAKRRKTLRSEHFC